MTSHRLIVAGKPPAFVDCSPKDRAADSFNIFGSSLGSLFGEKQLLLTFLQNINILQSNYKHLGHHA